MLKSMTAYGRACVVCALGRLTVEIQSVNRKHLEINTFLPKELLRYDTDIKKWLGAAIHRGQVNVKVFAAFDRLSPLVVTPNLPLAKQIKAAWDLIAQELDLSVKQGFTLEMLASEPGILQYEEDDHDEELFRDNLQQAVMQALKQLVAMKEREGSALHDDIQGRSAKLAILVADIAKKAPGATARYRQRLIERLEEVMPGRVESDERLLREVCLYAERIDIEEELTRFHSHLQQFEALLNSQKPAVGKTVEFLVQELNRETNTIGSKSSDIDVTHLVVDIKSELERIREQIQNVE
jgi:uncharacterized protein (TIGR00255 family)